MVRVTLRESLKSNQQPLCLWAAMCSRTGIYLPSETTVNHISQAAFNSADRNLIDALGNRVHT